VFDLEPLLDAPAFIPLKDPAIFQDVKLDYGIPTWCDGRIDLSPAFIYVKGKRKIVEETKSKY
jgi:hypothetical protein